MRRDFTPLFYTVDDMEGRDARVEDKSLDTLLTEKCRR